MGLWIKSDLGRRGITHLNSACVFGFFKHVKLEEKNSFFPMGKGLARSASSWCAWKSGSWLTNMLAFLLCSVAIHQHLPFFFFFCHGLVLKGFYGRGSWFIPCAFSTDYNTPCCSYGLQSIILCLSLWLEEVITRRNPVQDLHCKDGEALYTFKSLSLSGFLRKTKVCLTEGITKAATGACGDWYKAVTAQTTMENTFVSRNLDSE